MDDEFRARIADELAGSDEPPIGDIVAGSINKGRRMRTVRRFGFGGSAAAGVLAVSLGVAALAAPHDAPAGPATALPAAASSAAATSSPAAASSPSAASKSASKPEVRATPAGLLTLLLQLLPPGQTSHYRGDAHELMVQTYLDSGHGPGMIRVAVFDNGKSGTAKTPPAGSGTALPDGSTYRVTRIPENCVQDTIVFVQHADGTMVQINLAGCLAWDGKQNKPAPLALTVDQAVKVGADPRWGVRIDKSLVTAGAKNFPHLGAIE